MYKPDPSVCFFIFIAYEFKRFFADRKWWHFVTEAGELRVGAA